MIVIGILGALFLYRIVVHYRAEWKKRKVASVPVAAKI